MFLEVTLELLKGFLGDGKDICSDLALFFAARTCAQFLLNVKI